MKEATIRAADPERDAPACARIYAPSVMAAATSFEESAPDAVEMARRISAVAATHAWLVAELDGVVLGYAYACRHRERAAYRWATDVSVYVAEEHRGLGVARALYEELFARLRAQRFRVACAGITLPNEASVALHEHLGFTPVGVFNRIGWKAGAWQDVGWWQLQLGGSDQANPPAEPLAPQPRGAIRLPLGDA